MTDLEKALDYWKQHWLAPMPATELSHRDEPEKEIYRAARRWANLTSPETIEKAGLAVFNMDDIEGRSWDAQPEWARQWYFKVAEAVLRSVQEGET